MDVHPGCLLGKITNPDDLKSLPATDLPLLAEEIRQFLTDNVEDFFRMFVSLDNCKGEYEQFGEGTIVIINTRDTCLVSKGPALRSFTSSRAALSKSK